MGSDRSLYALLPYALHQRMAFLWFEPRQMPNVPFCVQGESSRSSSITYKANSRITHEGFSDRRNCRDRMKRLPALWLCVSPITECGSDDISYLRSFTSSRRISVANADCFYCCRSVSGRVAMQVCDCRARSRPRAGRVLTELTIQLYK